MMGSRLSIASATRRGYRAGYRGRMSTYAWRYEGIDGSPLTPADLPDATFPNQADAESWVGESWRELLASGVEQVSLLCDGEVVYGGMGLRPLE
jgi:hypothetical protein